MVLFSFFFNFFCYFLEISITRRVGTHLNDFYFFCFLFSLFLGLPVLILAWKEATMVFFNFFEFFSYFILIFYYGSGRNSLKRFFFIFLFSLFLCLPQNILAWKEATMVFFNFLTFFAIFFEFSIAGRVGTHWNNFIYF